MRVCVSVCLSVFPIDLPTTSRVDIVHVDVSLFGNIIYTYPVKMNCEIFDFQ